MNETIPSNPNVFTMSPNGCLPSPRSVQASQRVGVVPFMGEGSYDPEQFAAGADPLGPGPQPEPTLEEPSSARGVTEGTPADEQTLQEFTASVGEEFEGRQTSTPEPRDVVMHVRSRVTSYWRGRLFYEFDGRTWYPARESGLTAPRRSERSYYWQAYFIDEDQPNSLFVGYNPLRVILPEDLRERRSLVEGSTYSVLSQQPPLSSRAIQLDRPGRREQEYLAVPEGSEFITDLAKEITAEANTPFEGLWLIVSYLRQRHPFNVTAEDQLQLTGSIEDFMVVGTPGTSLDFATATVLMARAVGLPARLASGYLPGRFDPFSGTHRVRRKDAHAWAEVRFRRNCQQRSDIEPS